MLAPALKAFTSTASATGMIALLALSAASATPAFAENTDQKADGPSQHQMAWREAPSDHLGGLASGNLNNAPSDPKVSPASVVVVNVHKNEINGHIHISGW